ncbi:hypothetical protein [Ferrovibrio xuzhouensis]|uniref:Uncharacterized protein n=1 Tax=Ferrovibrio xuzhouensis TaxID=1576914 RepID=A0ABV7VE49_9PROT
MIAARVEICQLFNVPGHDAGFKEPSLQDILDDPMVQLLMARDGVKAADLRSICARGIASTSAVA